MLSAHFIALAFSASFALSSPASPPQLAPELFTPLIAQKILATAKSFPNPAKYPQYTDRIEGKWKSFDPDGWTTGFFPATLYAMHERTKLCGGSGSGGNAAEWLELGRTWATPEIYLEKNNKHLHHDVGFVSFPFMAELSVNPHNQTAITAVNEFAKDLAERFSPIVGCTRSWDSSNSTDFQVIIDNMMNLEVLFASEALTGNSTLRDIAVSHANKTMANHVRSDGSSYHVVDYNANTGAVMRQRTAQGYSDSSTWSRGQAWGIYGFANMFKHTKDTAYMQTSRRMADYFIGHLPADGFVPWDFNAPLDPPRPADSSAAMIAANGMLLLAEQARLVLQDEDTAEHYTQAAIKIINDNTKLAWAPAWQSLLSNGTVNKPGGNYLTGIVYGDYYFVKAGNELLSRGLARC